MASTTFPRLLLEHAAQRPDAPALREKEYGIWQTTTWSQLAAMVRRKDSPFSQSHRSRLLGTRVGKAWRRR